MKSRESIIETLEDAKEGAELCTDEKDRLIYQGWVEALNWVLNIENNYERKEK